MSEDRTHENLVKIVLSPIVSKLDFSALSASIKPVEIMNIYTNIVTGNLAIDTTGNDIGADAEAQYVQSKNLFLFPRQNYGNNSEERMHILHECVHAAADIKGTWLSFYFDWEVVSYISGTMFHRLETGAGPPSSWNSIFMTADAIGQKVIQTPGLRITLDDAFKLRELIRAHPAYAGISTGELSGNDG